jgi:hypothetical protein
MIIIALAKHLVPANRALSQGDWLPVTDEYKSIEDPSNKCIDK